jgi:hypothetical protein
VCELFKFQKVSKGFQNLKKTHQTIPKHSPKNDFKAPRREDFGFSGKIYFKVLKRFEINLKNNFLAVSKEKRQENPLFLCETPRCSVWFSAKVQGCANQVLHFCTIHQK